MSPRKLTEDDKQEILQLYRNSEATTSTLATRYEVSSSTISRFLKNKLSSTEYEDLIQQKRLARTPRGEKSAAKEKKASTKKKTKTKTAKTTKATKKKSSSKAKQTETETVATLEQTVSPADTATESDKDKDSKSTPTRRRRRRRSTAVDEPVVEETVVEETVVVELEDFEVEPQLEQPDFDAQPEDVPEEVTVSDLEAEVPSKSNRLILKSDRVEVEEDDEDEDEVDIITLKEMLGEDLEDINDEEDEEDEEDDWEDQNDEVITYSTKGSTLSDLQILPLSQASFPRTCYLVIDRSAELIVKPLADFADLGKIPQEEVKQRTLPVFDNHRIAKRFSHRRERVIKVPDGRMLQKTSQYLHNKGITRLLIDGQIYSLF